jgi:hypothetical protein
VLKRWFEFSESFSRFGIALFYDASFRFPPISFCRFDDHRAELLRAFSFTVSTRM